MSLLFDNLIAEIDQKIIDSNYIMQMLTGQTTSGADSSGDISALKLLTCFNIVLHVGPYRVATP